MEDNLSIFWVNSKLGGYAFYGFLIQASVTEIYAFYSFFIGAFIAELCPVEVYRNLFSDPL